MQRSAWREWLLNDGNDRRKTTHLLFVCVFRQGTIVELQCSTGMGDFTGRGRLWNKIARISKTSVDSINYRSHNLNGHPRGIGTLSTYDRSCQNILKLSLVSDYSFNKVLHYKYSAHYIFDYFVSLLPLFFKKIMYISHFDLFFPPCVEVFLRMSHFSSPVVMLVTFLPET